MMQTEQGEELYEEVLSQPNDSMSQSEQESVSWMYVETYYKAEWYNAMYQCSDDSNNEICYNSKFELSNQSDTRLEGFCLYDGIRAFNIYNCDYNDVPFIPLPEGVVPDPGDAPNSSYLFDLDPNNNGPIFGLDPVDRNPANYHSFELLIDEEDPIIPNLISPNPPSGNRSIRVNNTHVKLHINKMERSFKVTPENSTYFFSMAFVLEDPISHPPWEVPFASALVRSPSGQIIDQVCYVSDKDNPNLNAVNVPFYSPIVYRDWGCEVFDLSGYIDSTVTIEFTASDCGYGEHFGYMYVADICEDCRNMPDISLDSAYYPCPQYPLKFCGKYSFPDSIYNLIDITWEIQEIDDGVVYEDALISSSTDSTYCFEVDLDVADSIGLGSYDVYSIMTLVDTVGGDTMNFDTVEIRSLSSNQNTQFSKYNDFVVGNDSCTDVTLDSLFNPCPDFPLQFCGENNVPDSLYDVVDIEWEIQSINGVIYEDTLTTQPTDSTFCFRVSRSAADSIGDGYYDVEAILTLVDTVSGDTSMFDTIQIRSGTSNPNTEFVQYNDFIIGNDSCNVCPEGEVDAFASGKCLYGPDHTPITVHIDGWIKYEDGYSWCSGKSYIEWDSAEFTNPLGYNTSFADEVNFSGILTMEYNNSRTTGTVYLCDEEGNLCPFDFSFDLCDGDQLICPSPSIHCFNWDDIPYQGWDPNYPQFQQGVGHVYIKTLALPFILSEPECEITDYTVNVYAKPLMQQPTLVFSEVFTNPADTIPHVVFDSIDFSVTSVEWNKINEFLIEITNNCEDSCTYTLPKDGSPPRQKMERELDSWTVYPNPADKSFYIDYKGGKAIKESVSVSIYNTVGKRVEQEKYDDVPIKIDNPAWPNGLYWIKIQNGSEESEVVPIIID